MLRGFALLGILVMNIQAFAMPHAAYLNPTVYGSLEGLNGLAWVLGRLFFDLKFLSLFSLLFGASLVLAGDGPHARPRLLWLALFGAAHGPFLFYGDILFTYGTVGLLVLPARTWSPGRQAGVGAALLLIGPLMMAVAALSFDVLPPWLLADLHRHYTAEGLEAELAAFRGGWLSQLPVRAALAFDNQVVGTLLDAGWRAGGCILLGMAAIRAGVFEGRGIAYGWGWTGFLAGFCLTAAGIAVQWRSNFALEPWLFAQALHELGAVGVTAGLGLGIAHLARRFSSSQWVEAVGRLGRVAFSAYIMQSVVGLAVFGGQGFGQFGNWSRAGLMLAPPFLWGLQLGLAWWWTSRFRFGPLEALWRRLYRGPAGA